MTDDEKTTQTGDTTDTPRGPGSGAEGKGAGPAKKPEPTDDLVTTHHTLHTPEGDLSYAATTGRIVLRQEVHKEDKYDGRKPKAEVSITYYTLDPSTGSGQRADYAAYFFPYFTGESTADGETISFAVSNGPDPLEWTTLNGGKPVLSSTLGTKGLRDPFLIRGGDGTYYLLATDLQIYGGGNFGDAQETGSRSLMVWESTDLVNWGEQREIELAPENAGNLWAPEAYWDEAAGEFVVYWASALYPADVPPAERDIRTSYQRMLYATTTDFETFSEPQPWIDEPQGDGLGMIDSTVQEEDGVYYRLTKDESYMGMRQESSTDLRRTQGVTDGDGWDLIAERIGFGQPNPWGGTFTGGEGPTLF
ncbi:glycoside hydrolase family 43 protein, partial [Streptomyces griseoincarnatus]